MPLCQNSAMPDVYVERLSEEELADVVALERRIYPLETQDPVEAIEACLRFEDEHYSALNLGLFADGKLVGYILANGDDGSEFPDLAIGENVYIADLAILPEYRRHLIRLLTSFARELRLEYPGLPVVAHSIGDTGDLWRRHDAVMRRLGVSMIAQANKVAMDVGSTESLMWQPIEAIGMANGRTPKRAAARTGRYCTTSGKTLAASVISDEEGLIGLAESWEAIEKEITGLTVFQTHRYQAAWTRSLGLSDKLMVICIFDGPRLEGIAPFQVSLHEMHGKVYRQLSFLGAPWEVDRPGFLFRRNARACGEAAALALLARRDEWDIIWFHEQTAGDPALESFCATIAGSGLLHGRTASSRCPYLKFEGSWPELLASKSQKFRKNLKAARRKLEEAGLLQYERHSGSEERLQELLMEYEELEGRGWKGKAGVGASQSVEHMRFYMHLASAFGGSGQFVFRCLRLDGRMIAATFGLTHEQKFYSLHIANDAKYSRFSPGTYLESLELEECFGAGLDEYDFLGGFLSNKLRWATRTRETVAVYLYQRQPRLIVSYILYFIVKPPLKRMLSLFGVRWPDRSSARRGDGVE